MLYMGKIGGWWDEFLQTRLELVMVQKLNSGWIVGMERRALEADFQTYIVVL